MHYNSNIHRRRSIRLHNYDYSAPGAYFVTGCIHQRECLLGDIINKAIDLNAYGQVVQRIWQKLPDRFDTVDIDAAVIMPNHFHGIIILSNVSQKTTLGQIIAYFKYLSTKEINRLRDTPEAKVWQRNYYEHIIRSEISLQRLREYIAHNPLN